MKPSVFLKACVAQWFGIPCQIRWVRPKNKRGNTKHYYHFVVDAWVPLALFLQRFPGAKCLLPKTELGNFSQIVDKWLPQPSEHRWAIRIAIRGLNPKFVKTTAEQWKTARDWTFERLNLSLEPRKFCKLILLIDRTDEGEDRGAERRSISNMDQLEALLKSALQDGLELRRVDLARLPWREQVMLFRDAQLVIGQHGAGLVNMLWMQNDAPVVEIGNFRSHFVHLAQQTNRPHFCFEAVSDHPQLSLGAFARFLRDKPSLASFFKNDILEATSFKDPPPPERNLVVITGLPKTGTSLLAALLDGHPDLFVFPQELRFFHLRLHELPPLEAHTALFSNPNIQALAKEISSLKTGGAGRREQPNLTPVQFEAFSEAVRAGFLNAKTVRDRMEAIFAAWQQVLGGVENKRWVIRAPQSARFAPHFDVVFEGKVHWVLMNRTPETHLASLRQFRSRKGQDVQISVKRYTEMLEKHDMFSNKISSVKSHKIQLETLQNPLTQLDTVNNLYEFLGLEMRTTMPEPTTYGAMWYGNLKGGATKSISESPQSAKISTRERLLFAYYRLRKSQGQRRD